MVFIRILTDKGNELFRDYILDVRINPTAPSPVGKLGHAPWSTEFSPHIEIDNLTATTRIQLGKYLTELFNTNGVDRREILNNPGMWSWLALVWFDYLCPVEDNNSRKVREASRYICSTHYTDYYRHLIAASWDLFYMHGNNSRLFLWTPLYIHNDFIEQLASRQNIITNKPLIEVFDRLYWDQKASHPKTGAQSRNRAGNFRRLQSFIQQIELTYDLHAMSAEDIITLLPNEYNPWKVFS